MSNLQRITRDPLTQKWELATWLDGYFGGRYYGVKFPDGTIYNQHENDLEVKED